MIFRGAEILQSPVLFSFSLQRERCPKSFCLGSYLNELFDLPPTHPQKTPMTHNGQRVYTIICMLSTVLENAHFYFILHVFYPPPGSQAQYSVIPITVIVWHFVNMNTICDIHCFFFLFNFNLQKKVYFTWWRT